MNGYDKLRENPALIGSVAVRFGKHIDFKTTSDGVRPLSFDNAAMRKLKIVLDQKINKSAACKLLNITTAQLHQLRITSCIRPILPQKRNPAYARTQLEKLLETLRSGAPATSHAASDEVLLTKAAVICELATLPVVVKLIEEGVLIARGRLRDVTGLPGIVIAIDALLAVWNRRPRAEGASAKIVGADALADELMCTPSVARGLIAAHVLTSELPSVKKRAGWTVPVFTADHIAAFRSDYVSLRELECRLPMSPSEILAEIKARRIAGVGSQKAEAAYFPRQRTEFVLGLFTGPVNPSSPSGKADAPQAPRRRRLFQGVLDLV